jgi:hypothetical protein
MNVDGEDGVSEWSELNSGIVLSKYGSVLYWDEWLASDLRKFRAGHEPLAPKRLVEALFAWRLPTTFAGYSSPRG